MSNQISLTIPNDDPIALRAFGNALEEMAVAHGAESRKSVAAMTVKIDGTEAAQAVRGVLEEFTAEPADDTDDETVDTDTQLVTNDTIDADGLPWDARIHSGNQERNADNTWRVRRRPKDLTPEQWAEQVAQVRDELFALMAIPVVTSDYSVDAPAAHKVMTVELGCDPAYYADESPAAVFGAPVAEIVTVSEHPVVVEQSSGGLSLGFIIQSEPLPPIADPVLPAPAPLPPATPIADPVPPAPAPLPTTTTALPATLAELMTWLTSKAPSDDAGRAARLAQINGIVARHGLVALAQLQKRLDLIPQVYADLVKELGQ